MKHIAAFVVLFAALLVPSVVSADHDNGRHHPRVTTVAPLPVPVIICRSATDISGQGGVIQPDQWRKFADTLAVINGGQTALRLYFAGICDVERDCRVQDSVWGKPGTLTICLDVSPGAWALTTVECEQLWWDGEITSTEMMDGAICSRTHSSGGRAKFGASGTLHKWVHETMHALGLGHRVPGENSVMVAGGGVLCPDAHDYATIDDAHGHADGYTNMLLLPEIALSLGANVCAAVTPVPAPDPEPELLAWRAIPYPLELVRQHYVLWQFEALNCIRSCRYELASGDLPPGMALYPTGWLSGAPRGQLGRDYAFTVRATDEAGRVATTPVWVSVVAKLSPVTPTPVPTAVPTVAPTPLPTATPTPTPAPSEPLAMAAPAPQPFIVTQGSHFTYQFTASGGTLPYRYAQGSGVIPAGLTLSPEGVLSGTVIAFPGEFIFTVTVFDGAAVTGSAVWIKVQ